MSTYKKYIDAAEEIYNEQTGKKNLVKPEEQPVKKLETKVVKRPKAGDQALRSRTL